MTRTATLIPVHAPKLAYAINLLKSWEKFSDSEIAFVFSSEEEKEYLKNNSDYKFKSYIAPDTVLSNKNIITAKKFWGLDMLFGEGYSHVGVFDAEISVVKPFNTDNIYPLIYSKKELKCNRSSRGGELIKSNATILDMEKDLVDITDNFIQYWWFNEICVYENNDFGDFIKFISEEDKKNKIFSAPNYFDYIVYGCYLLKYKNFKLTKFLQDREYEFGTIEHNLHDYESQIFKSYADHNPNHEKHEHIKVLIHLDRIV